MTRSKTRKRQKEVVSPSNALGSDIYSAEKDRKCTKDKGGDPVKEYVEQLGGTSKYTYNSEGHPTYEFSALVSDGTLYDLEIQVKQSKIINAGMGAFLTFKGARVPKKKRLLEAAVYDESDYISHPTKELHSEDFSIELGCYGPMLETDRKCEPYYEVKNYCYSDYPSEYALGVTRKIAGCTQVIDITDDATGMRHEEALARPWSYINEVGHSQNLRPNVYLREKSESSVYYYLVLTEALKKGETVELLANYNENSESYEYVRELKGYGKISMENGDKSDDYRTSVLVMRNFGGGSEACEPSVLVMRNFEDRQWIEKLVNGLDQETLFHLTDFLFSKMLSPLLDVTEAFLQDKSQVQPTHLQWVARHRLSWLAELILQKCMHLSQELPCMNHLKKTQEHARNMLWPSLHQCIRSLGKDEDVRKVLEVATRYDIMYRVSEKIVKPFNPTIWYPEASDLMVHLCNTSMMSHSNKTLNIASCLSAQDGNCEIEKIELMKEYICSVNALLKGKNYLCSANALTDEKNWYLTCQAVYILQSFVEEFITNSKIKVAKFSFQTLCSHLGVDPEKVKAVFNRGIERKDYPAIFFGEPNPKKIRLYSGGIQ